MCHHFTALLQRGRSVTYCCIILSKHPVKCVETAVCYTTCRARSYRIGCHQPPFPTHTHCLRHHPSHIYHLRIARPLYVKMIVSAHVTDSQAENGWENPAEVVEIL